MGQKQEGLSSALYLTRHISLTLLPIQRWSGFAGTLLPTCLILLFRNLLTTNPCRVFTALISQVTYSPLSALTFQFASYLKLGSSTKWTAFHPHRHVYSKVWYTSIVAPTLLPHLFTRELLVTKWAELHSARLGKNSLLTVLRKCKNSKEDCLGHNVRIQRLWNIFAEHDFMTKWKLVYRKIHPLKLFSMEVLYVHSNESKKTVSRLFFFSNWTEIKWKKLRDN